MGLDFYSSWAPVTNHLASPHAPCLPAQEFVIPEEEAEWVGLTLDEAVEKQRLLEEKVSVCECQRLYPLEWHSSQADRWGGRKCTALNEGHGKELLRPSSPARAIVLWILHGTFSPLMVLTLFCSLWPTS